MAFSLPHIQSEAKIPTKTHDKHIEPVLSDLSKKKGQRLREGLK